MTLITLMPLQPFYLLFVLVCVLKSVHILKPAAGGMYKSNIYTHVFNGLLESQIRS